MKQCSIEGCTDKHYGKSYCRRHYQRMYKNIPIEGEFRIKHGESKSAEYGVWCGIKKRCYKSSENSYKNYGARGIKVCDEWKNDYLQFLKDMGRRPTDNHSIERIDTNGNYEPGNCRWATRHEQTANTRRNVSGKVGVTYDKRTNKWFVRLHVDNRRILQTTRSTYEEAVALRLQYEKQYNITYYK